MISAKQALLARTMIEKSQAEMAKTLGWAHQTLSKIEKGDVNPPASRLRELQDFYENEGVEFIDGDGVRKNLSTVRVYKGRTEFLEFKDDVRETAIRGGTGRDICINNVDERDFQKWGGESNNLRHRTSMEEIENLKCRILVKENDTYFTATGYAEYRWLPATVFENIPFYIYGDKTAIIAFEEHEVQAFVINNPLVTEFYRKQFEEYWKMAIIPPKTSEKQK